MIHRRRFNPAELTRAPVRMQFTESGRWLVRGEWWLGWSTFRRGLERIFGG